jgi:hypothetical protein
MATKQAATKRRAAGKRRARKKVTTVDCGWPEELPGSKIRCPKCRAVLYDYATPVDEPKCEHFLFCWDDSGPMLYCHDALSSWESRIAKAAAKRSRSADPELEEAEQEEGFDDEGADDRPMPDVEALAKLLDVNIVVFKVEGFMGRTYVAVADRPLP